MAGFEPTTSCFYGVSSTKVAQLENRPNSPLPKIIQIWSPCFRLSAQNPDVTTTASKKLIREKKSHVSFFFLIDFYDIETSESFLSGNTPCHRLA